MESQYVLDELHNEICGFHTDRRTLKARVIRAGYFWPTMEEDAKNFVQKCPTYQAHANDPHVPLAKLHSIISLWSFAQWGVNIVRPLPPGRS